MKRFLLLTWLALAPSLNALQPYYCPPILAQVPRNRFTMVNSFGVGQFRASELVWGRSPEAYWVPLDSDRLFQIPFGSTNLLPGVRTFEDFDRVALRLADPKLIFDAVNEWLSSPQSPIVFPDQVATHVDQASGGLLFTVRASEPSRWSGTLELIPGDLPGGWPVLGLPINRRRAYLPFPPTSC